jgi:hypothetical protein
VRPQSTILALISRLSPNVSRSFRPRSPLICSKTQHIDVGAGLDAEAGEPGESARLAMEEGLLALRECRPRRRILRLHLSPRTCATACACPTACRSNGRVFAVHASSVASSSCRTRAACFHSRPGGTAPRTHDGEPTHLRHAYLGVLEQVCTG